MEPSQDDRGRQLVIVTSIFLAISWVSVLLRCFVRTTITKSFKADDWLMASAMVRLSPIQNGILFGHTAYSNVVLIHDLFGFHIHGREKWLGETQRKLVSR